MMDVGDRARGEGGDDAETLAPRRGPLGAWDHLVGPGASTVENVGTVAGILAGALAAPRLAHLEGKGPSWAGARRGAVAVIAADLWGGVWCNATPAARRWYHRPGQGLPQQMAFAAAHVHPFIVAVLFRDRDWPFAAGNYGYLLMAMAVIAAAPPALRRPVALTLYAGAIVLNLYRWRPTVGVEWFAPVFFLKLLVAHALGDDAASPRAGDADGAAGR